MDINKALRSAIDTGTVQVGTRESCKAAGAGTAKLIIISTNCPEEAASQVKESKTLLYIVLKEIMQHWVPHVVSHFLYLLSLFSIAGNLTFLA